MKIFQHLKERWGVGPWNLVAILAAFALAGTTIVKLKNPVTGFFLPPETPAWLQWTFYLVVLLPLYQLLLLGYGTLLGQFRFFWDRMKSMGRLLSRFTSPSD